MTKQLLFAVLLSLILCDQLIAQIPQHFNYQCALRDANGEVLANTSVTVRFTFRNAHGEAVTYQERHVATTSEFGLVNLNIGAGEVTQFSWNNLDWGGFEYLLQVEVDLGSGFVDMGTSAFDTVPFSILSEKAIDMNLGDLTDVETYMGVSDGQVLRFNGDENYWEPGRPSLDDLSDVNYEEQPVDGDRLVYSDYYAEWVPSSVVPGFAEGPWSTNGANTYLIAGLVGVGTSAPSGKLHINDGSLRISKTEFGSGLIDGLNIGLDGTGNAVFANYENTDMIFSTGFTERFRLGATGPLLPLDNPGHKFHIKSTFPGLGMHLTYTNSGHNETDGVRIGLNGSSELEINQQENQNILFKRNGSTKATITSAGATINGTLTADALSAPTVNTTEVYATDVNAFNIQALSMTSGGNRPVYVNNSGQLYPAATIETTQYLSICGQGFHTRDVANFSETSDPESVYADYRGTLVFSGAVCHAYYNLHLPQGATIDCMTAYFQDNVPETHITVKLYQTGLSTGTTELMGILHSSVLDGAFSQTTCNLSFDTVDNEDYAYMIVVDKVGPGYSEDLEYLWLKGVRIAYTNN